MDEDAGGCRMRQAGAIPTHSGQDGGLGFDPARPAGKRLFVQHNPEPAKRFTSLWDLQKSPPASARSSAGGLSIWRGKEHGKWDVLQHQAGLLTQIAEKTLA